MNWEVERKRQAATGWAERFQWATGCKASPLTARRRGGVLDRRAEILWSVCRDDREELSTTGGSKLRYPDESLLYYTAGVTVGQLRPLRACRVALRSASQATIPERELNAEAFWLLCKPGR